jgi:hypothetical protein
MFKVKGDYVSKNSASYGSSKAGKVPTMGKDFGLPSSSGKRSGKTQPPAVDFTKERNNNAQNDTSGKGSNNVASKAQRRSGPVKSF